MDDCCDLLCLDLPTAESARRALPPPTDLIAAAERAKALSDPNRLALASALATSGELCVCDLSWIVNKPQNLVSHHLGKLRSSALATARRDGRIVYYALTESGRATLATLVGDAEESLA